MVGQLEIAEQVHGKTNRAQPQDLSAARFEEFLRTHPLDHFHEGRQQSLPREVALDHSRCIHGGGWKFPSLQLRRPALARVFQYWGQETAQRKKPILEIRPIIHHRRRPVTPQHLDPIRMDKRAGDARRHRLREFLAFGLVMILPVIVDPFSVVHPLSKLAGQIKPAGVRVWKSGRRPL